MAFIEVLICSDVLTQFAIGGTLLALGYPAQLPGGQLNVGYVVALSLGDAVLLVGLILFCSTRTASGRATCCSAAGRSSAKACSACC